MIVGLRARALIMRRDPRLWERWVPAGILLLGLLERVAWLQLSRPLGFRTQTEGETLNVAHAFSRTWKLNDAFAVGQGPTAHVMPLQPIIAGTVYRIFGVDSATSEAVLLIIALTSFTALGYLLFMCMRELGVPLVARLLGLAFFSLFPLNFAFETIWFKVWEGSIAAACGAAFLYFILRLDRAGEPDLRDIVLAGVAASLVLFVSPPLGLAAYACGALLVLHRVPPRRWLRSIMLVLAVTIVVLTPWTVRNFVVLGRPIILRDNFGLEMALGNFSDAADNPNRQAAFLRHFVQMHPLRNGYMAMKAAGGEVAYADKLMAETKEWIRENPEKFARLTLRHLSEFYFPPPWYWTQFNNAGSGIIGKVLFLSVTALLAFSDLLRGLKTSWRYSYIACMALLPSIPYAFVQPNLRYRYIINGVLLFLALDFLVYVFQRLFAVNGTASGHTSS